MAVELCPKDVYLPEIEEHQSLPRPTDKRKENRELVWAENSAGISPKPSTSCH